MDIEVKRFDPVAESAARIAFEALFKPAERRTVAEKTALRIAVDGQRGGVAS